MDFNKYQVEARKTAIYPKEPVGAYPALGLNGEAGEVAEKVKKRLRDHKEMSCFGLRYVLVKDACGNCEHRDACKDAADAIANEIGDVLWYCAALADDFGLKLDKIAEDNIGKLASRKERNKLRGSGDDR